MSIRYFEQNIESLNMAGMDLGPAKNYFRLLTMWKVKPGGLVEIEVHATTNAGACVTRKGAISIEAMEDLNAKEKELGFIQPEQVKLFRMDGTPMGTNMRTEHNALMEKYQAEDALYTQELTNSTIRVTAGIGSFYANYRVD